MDTLSSAKRLTATGEEEPITSPPCSALLRIQGIHKNMVHTLRQKTTGEDIVYIINKQLVALRVGSRRRKSRRVFKLPVREGEWFHLLIQVPMQHVFVAGDPQSFGHGICVKGRVQSHHSTMNPFTLKIVCILLKSTTHRQLRKMTSVFICSPAKSYIGTKVRFNSD